MRIKTKRGEEKSPITGRVRKERTEGRSKVHLGKIKHGYKHLNYLRCARYQLVFKCCLTYVWTKVEQKLLNATHNLFYRAHTHMQHYNKNVINTD